MATTLDPTRYRIDPIDDGWMAGDSRTLNFTVVQGGDPKDITNDEVEWYLIERPYHKPAEALLSGDDASVDIRTEDVVDPTAGEFRVDIKPEATECLWGEYHQLVVVDPPVASRQSWRGDVVVEAQR